MTDGTTVIIDPILLKKLESNVHFTGRPRFQHVGLWRAWNRHNGIHHINQCQHVQDDYQLSYQCLGHFREFMWHFNSGSKESHQLHNMVAIQLVSLDQGAHFDDEVVSDDTKTLDTQAEPHWERNPGDDPRCFAVWSWRGWWNGAGWSLVKWWWSLYLLHHLHCLHHNV